MTDLTHEELIRLLDYDPETGVFRWKVGGPGKKAGSVAGSKGAGVNQIKINRQSYTLRNLAWFYISGEMPRNKLFVKNGDRYDDRIDNIGMLPDQPRELTHEYLKQCIDYNPETGEFKWKITQSNNQYGGDAFCFHIREDNRAECTTQILRKKHKTLRLIVLWMTGYMPSPNRLVMPIDNNILNMKWNNIKVGSRLDSNVKRRVYGLCSMKGVYWDKSNKRYRAKIKINGKQKHLGNFKTEAEAHEAYMKAARNHYGELTNDGYEHAIYHMETVPVERDVSAQQVADISEGKAEPGRVRNPEPVDVHF